MSLSKRARLLVPCLVALALPAAIAVAANAKLLPTGDEPSASGTATLVVHVKSYSWGGGYWDVYAVTLKVKCTGLRPGQTYRADTSGVYKEGVADAKGVLVISAYGEYSTSSPPPTEVGVARRDPGEALIGVLSGWVK